MKYCSDCDTSKSVEEFYKNICTKDGLSTVCKMCQKIRVKDWHNKNPNKQSEYAAKNRNKNRIANLAEKVV